MRSSQEIKLELIQLIQEAQPVYPKLASRLDEINRWIAKKKDGLLMRKKHVMQLLSELVADTTFWLSVQSLSEEDREAEFAELSPTEQYWYKYLFPAWFNEPDPKQKNWQRNLMAEQFAGSDAAFINKICLQIEKCGGSTSNPYIADLSMATEELPVEKRNLSCVFN